jgi:glycosyltransferase involved in cell wall biosynthesis
MADQNPSLIFITRKWPPAMGGMETYCFKLVEELRKRHVIETIALPGNADGSVPGLLRMALFGLKTTRRILLGPALPDLLHVGDMASWPFALLARLRRPSSRIVISAHGTDVSYGRRAGWRGRAYRTYLRVGSFLLDHARVIANSEATSEACQEAGFRHIAIITPASDFQMPTPIPKTRRNVLFAGRLIRQKGLSWFVANVLPFLPTEIELDVAGSIWNAEEAAALSHARVNYLGCLDQQSLSKAYAAALCVVVPNIKMPNGEFEGFGLVAVEAAASGGVVLASDLGGLRNAVVNGVTGFLVRSEDAPAWVTKISEIGKWTDTKRVQFVAGSLTQIRAYSTWARVGEETEAVYDLTTPNL